jgi:membrane-associated phospholipid phosphatase
MIAMPGTRVIAIILSVPMLLSLVAMNYHFVSDVIAGSVLGALIAAYAVHLARLKKCRASIPVSDSSNSRATRVNALRDV